MMNADIKKLRSSLWF